MSLGEQQAIYQDLCQSIGQVPYPDGPLQPSRQAYLQSQVLEEDARVGPLRSLTTHFYLASKLDTVYAIALADTLAEVTKRQPLWRTLFGLRIRQQDIPYESILHVASGLKQFESEECQDLRRNCLRLIANCCADNDENRKFCLEHGVVGELIDLAASQLEVDILIPTLYNVCVDYQDPAEEANLAVNGDPQSPDGSTQPINLASQKLYEASKSNCTSFQILLSLTPVCSEDRKPYLAELVEMACSPTTHEVEPVSDANVVESAWQFVLHGVEWNTIGVASNLAEESQECRVHMVRGISSLLSNEPRRKDFLALSGDDRVWELATLASRLDEKADVDSDEHGEETAETRKQFLKMFYDLSSMSPFCKQNESNGTLIAMCIDSLSLSISGTNKSSSSQRAYALIILAQLAASDPVRQQLLSDQSLVDSLSHLLQTEADNDILYPAIVLISRLCRTDEGQLVLIQDRILQPMTRLLEGKGRGLIIPFEIVSTYKAMIRNRPDYLKDFVKVPDTGHRSVISGVLTLFDTTIEAGTKLEVGHFVIEILRTAFGYAKDLDTQNAPSESVASDFGIILDTFATEIEKVLVFVCAQAEPKEQRVHGWFGMGMLSVWKQGRLAIARVMDDSDLGTCLLDITKASDGPAAQNAKLMLSKMQLCHEEDLTSSTMSILQEAAKGLGFEFTTAAGR